MTYEVVKRKGKVVTIQSKNSEDIHDRNVAHVKKVPSEIESDSPVKRLKHHN